MTEFRPEIAIISGTAKGRALAGYIKSQSRESDDSNVLVIDHNLPLVQLLAGRPFRFSFDKNHSSFLKLPLFHSEHLEFLDLGALKWAFFIGPQTEEEVQRILFRANKKVISVYDDLAMASKKDLGIQMDWDVVERRFGDLSIAFGDGVKILRGGFDKRKNLTDLFSSLGIQIGQEIADKGIKWVSWTDSLGAG